MAYLIKRADKHLRRFDKVVIRPVAKNLKHVDDTLCKFDHLVIQPIPRGLVPAFDYKGLHCSPSAWDVVAEYHDRDLGPCEVMIFAYHFVPALGACDNRRLPKHHFVKVRSKKHGHEREFHWAPNGFSWKMHSDKGLPHLVECLPGEFTGEQVCHAVRTACDRRYYCVRTYDCNNWCDKVCENLGHPGRDFRW